MDHHLDPEPACRTIQRSSMSFVHNGLFDIQPAEDFSIFGSGVAEYQNRNCDAVLTQLDSFAQRRNREHFGSVPLKELPAFNRAVSVRIRFQNAYNPAVGTFFCIFKIMLKRAEIDLRPSSCCFAY